MQSEGLGKTIIRTPKGAIAMYSHLKTPLESASDFLDLMVDAGADTNCTSKKPTLPIASMISKPALQAKILQKLSNYDKRLIIIGDFASPGKKSLRDFIYESNRTGKVVFAATLEEGVTTLR